MKRNLVLAMLVFLSVASCAAPSAYQIDPTATQGVTVAATAQPPETAVTPDIKPTSENQGSTSAVKPFKISYSIELEQGVVTGETFFVGKYVIETVENPEDVDAIFDLSRQSWKDSESNQTVRFSDCEAWVQASIKKTQASLAATKDTAVKQFVETVLNPNFQVGFAGKGVLTLENDLFAYRITSSQTVAPEVLERYFDYERMSACRKAMIQKTIPPITQYEMLGEVKQRGMFPNELDLTMTLKDVTTIKTASTVADVTDSELIIIKSHLPK